MIDGHGLKVGDKVLVPLPSVERPPLWALWRWPRYWRECRFACDRSGVYVVESVHDGATFTIDGAVSIKGTATKAHTCK